MYTYSFTYFTNFFNKTNGQTCAKKSMVLNILKRREYTDTRNHDPQLTSEDSEVKTLKPNQKVINIKQQKYSILQI